MTTSITDILREHNIPYVGEEHRNVRAGWVGIDPCPWCGHGGSHGGYNLGINLNGAYASCWRCGPKRLTDVLHRLGVPFAATRGLAAKRQQYTRPAHTGRYTPPVGVGPMGGPHRRYLHGRGFNPDELEQLWGLQGIGISPQGLSWRIFIPVHQDGRAVAWTTRSIAPKAEKRYHASKPEQSAVPMSDVLYGLDYARFGVVVVEGPVDVWAVGPGAVCTLGLGYNRGQLDRLSRYYRGAVCFDNEPQAQCRARELVDELCLLGGSWSNIVLDANDPGSADKREIKALREAVLDA